MANTHVTNTEESWNGGTSPFRVSYGKLMMWIFLISDAFTFSTLLVVYGALRFSADVAWANPENVFTHFSGLTEWFEMHPPLAFVGLMTFILIASSVTMVLAVEAGHRKDRKQVEFYMLLTIVGGAMFLGCQAYEWYNFIVGTEFGAFHMADGTSLTVYHATWTSDVHTMATLVPSELILMNGEHVTGEAMNTLLAQDHSWVQGAGLWANQYSQQPSFGNLFFFITGFHGSHVASGVLLNIVIYLQVKNGVMDSRGHYEMVEKVGLYWHFVDLVWVFVFTFFYLV
jgi:cytochrome c oxidase subunit III